ncbi:MAG: O-antigen ligase family protein [Arcicella sp.]|nr:O-antigen ligase family protein [Arcicella sp.]
MKKLLFILILFTTLTPLVLFEKLPFPFVTEKTLYFRLLVDILLVVWAIVAFQNPDYLPRKTPLNFALLFLGIITLLTAIFGHDFQHSFWSGLERMEGFVGLFHALMFYFVLSNSVKIKAQWQTLFLTSCGVACVCVGVGIFREFEQIKVGERLFSSLGNPTYLGLYLILHVFLVGFVLVNNVSAIIKKLCFLIIPFLLIGVFLTQSRSAFLGLFLGGFVAFVFTIFSENIASKIRWRFAGLLFSTLLIFTVLWNGRNTEFVEKSTFLSRVVKVASAKTTGVSRLNNWKIAYEGFKEKPVLGWGQENYQYVFAKYFLPQMYDDAPWYDRSHNFLLDWLVLGGIFGLMAFLSPFGLIIWFTVHSSKFSNIQKGLFVGFIVAYFTNNFFGFDSLVSTMTVMMFMAYWESETQFEAKFVFPKLKIWGVLICVLISFFSFYYGYLQPLRTGKQIVKIMEEPDLQQTIQQIQLGYANAAGTGTSDFAEQVSFLSEKVGKSQIADEMKNGYYQVVADLLNKEVEKHPNHPRLLSIKSSIEADRGNFTEAINGFEKVQTLAPNRHINLMQLAGVYTRNQQLEKALNLYDDIYKINQNSEALFYKSLIYSDLNDTLNIWKSIQKMDDKVFIQKIEAVRLVYGKHNNLQGLVQEFNRREKVNPKLVYQFNKQAYFEWAMAAFVTGDLPQSADQVFRYLYGNGMVMSSARQSQEAVRNGRSPAEYFQ